MGFFGNLLSSVIKPLGSIGGSALGSLVGMPSLGSSVGGFLGDQASGLTSKIPFKAGGVLVQHPNGMIQVIPKKQKKGKAPKKRRAKKM